MRALSLPLSLILLATAAVPTAAQLRVIPQVGLYAPLSDLPGGDEAVEIGKRDASFAWGVGLRLGSFRLTALRGTDSPVPLAGVGCDECARSTLTAVTATWLWAPLPDLGPVTPYFMLGGGVRRLDFERSDLEEERFDAFFSDETDPAGHLGVGLEIELPVLRLTGELSDVLSRLEGANGDEAFQHDFFFTLGLSLGG